MGLKANLCEFLSSLLPVSLGPLDLPRVTFHLEVLVALAPAEAEYLRRMQDRLRVWTRPRQVIICHVAWIPWVECMLCQEILGGTWSGRQITCGVRFEMCRALL